MRPGPPATPAPEDRPRVVVVMRNSERGRPLAELLGRNGLAAIELHDTEAAINALLQHPTVGLVCEARAPRIDGLAVLELALAQHPGLCAVMIANSDTRSLAVAAVRSGGWDFELEPVDGEKLLATLRQGLEHQRLARRVADMEGQLDRQFGIRALSGSSRAIQRVRELAKRVASVRVSVLLEGEPGTGKSVVARSIHQASPRFERRLERVRCGAMPEALLEVELFGSARGGRGTPGAIERADGGTLILDEVEHLPRAVQLRMLRFVVSRQFERVGESVERTADVRVVSASDAGLEAAVKRGEFHADLAFALSVIRIAMPPLRERLEDLPALVEDLVRAANREHKRRVPGVTAGVLDRLARYAWPGNVRELRNVVDGMVGTARGRKPLDVESLPDALRGESVGESRLELSVGMKLEAAERRLIEATLAHTQGDKRRAAAILGVGLRTLYRRLDEWGLR